MLLVGHHSQQNKQMISNVGLNINYHSPDMTH